MKGNVYSNKHEQMRYFSRLYVPFQILMTLFCSKKKMNVHLSVISIVGEIHEHSEVG